MNCIQCNIYLCNCPSGGGDNYTILVEVYNVYKYKHKLLAFSKLYKDGVNIFIG